MSWDSLLSIVREARQQDQFWRSQRPAHCPRDGIVLQPGPGGVPRCRFCGYEPTGQDHP